jgi:hypothetical protein
MPSKIKTCEEYRTAMTDAAAGAVQPSLEFRSHLGACASCRAAFAEEAQLFAAIDSGVRATANAEVPAKLFSRVRVQLNERVVAHRSWVPAFATLATVATLIVAVVFLRGFGRDASETNPRMIVTAHNDSPIVIQPSPSTPVPIETTSPLSKIRSVRPVEDASVVKIERVAVLIPSGQKQAVDAFLTSVRQGKVRADVLLAEKPRKPLEELQVSPLDILPITVNPLVDVSPGSASQGETMRR